MSSGSSKFFRFVLSPLIVLITTSGPLDGDKLTVLREADKKQFVLS
jgi:hypothetical protein